MLLRSLTIFCFCLPLWADVDPWDLPPVKYSDTPGTDRLAVLAERWSKNPEAVPGATQLERMRGILAALGVPESSQILVFSKTSKQNSLIHPGNPRALYFSRDCYCGYVPGGLMEIAIQDPVLGPLFYAIDLGNEWAPPKVERDIHDCLSCHATGRTENVPGVLIRSVYPDGDGLPILPKGSKTITHQTPIADRWGGYYVTGSISLPHLGNRTFREGLTPDEPAIFAWKDLRDKIDTAKYPCATSDIVALMVLEHQCQAHNLLTAAAMNYKRAWYLSKALDPTGNPDDGSAGKIADRAAKEIVDWFVFTGEAEQGEDGVEGNDEFQRSFEAACPQTGGGDSLADFQLNGRMFKNACSYMIYSDAFRQLPKRVKDRVISGLRDIFEATDVNDEHPSISLSVRRRTLEILRETGVFQPTRGE